MTLYKSTFIMIFVIIFAVSHITRTSSESISNQIWANIIQDLSLKMNDQKSNDKTKENPPLSEGFMLLSSDRKKPLSNTFNSTDLIIFNRITTMYNISSTTCKTITIADDSEKTASPKVDHLVEKRSLDETNPVSNIEEPSKQMIMEIDDEMKNFLEVNDDALSRQLANAETTVDGSGTTWEDTTMQTSEGTVANITTTLPPTTMTSNRLTSTTTRPVLSNTTLIELKLTCPNASETLREIEDRFKKQYPHQYIAFIVDPKPEQINCSNSSSILVNMTFVTPNNATIINDIYETIDDITEDKDVEVVGNVCNDNKRVTINKVTACFLIDACGLCGTDPQRGSCIPSRNESVCECFVNKNDPSRPYAGEFCYPQEPIPIRNDNTPNWTPIIVGIVAAVTGLFCAITCCLWGFAAWRRRRSEPEKEDSRVFRLWHLPRAKLPTPVSNENVPYYTSNSLSTLSSNVTASDPYQSNTSDSTFFKELDQKMGENLRATRTRPNANAILASLPPDTISTISSDDPIDELDAIIDNEDLDLTFHDPLNDLFDDNDEMLEAINPNLQIPRPQVDSKPSGLFSFISKRL